MKRFRKKPVVIEAVQWDGSFEGAEVIAVWFEAHRTHFGWIMNKDADGFDIALAGIRIGTLEGDVTASPGDWIIRGVKGEFYPCKPDIFEATYEVVE